ncbi:hypothetical protein OESDEN_05120 [Oesophagostomum dentatum]|uniref:Uncharacterized protein n=1 Tax=Oesophagostomum dentatum TaxID=61180 RepID=A0A0B1TFP6_OESDE|nr:hypothetical protein OESDEN_05120 [Oesophagostomum dentatum]
MGDSAESTILAYAELLGKKKRACHWHYIEPITSENTVEWDPSGSSDGLTDEEMPEQDDNLSGRMEPEVGAERGEMVRHVFNTCLMHISDVDTWTPLVSSLQSLSTYKFYIKMASLHFNTLRLAELSGERRCEKVKNINRKYLARISELVFKIPVHHKRRDNVLEEVLDIRRKHFLEKQTNREAEEIDDETAAIMAVEEAFDQLRGSEARLEGSFENVLVAMELVMVGNTMKLTRKST